jgi:hypothetical protein
MTTMNESDLLSLGFNRNEAKVYLELVKFAKADAALLIRSTGFHKNIVYDNLEKLMAKGLVSYVAEEGRKVFRLEPAQMLLRLIEEKEEEILGQKDTAKRVAAEVSKSIVKNPQISESAILKGTYGVRLFYSESLGQGDYDSIGGGAESLEIMGEAFWKNFNSKRLMKKLRARLIFNESLRKHGDSIKDEITQVRYFRAGFEPLTETHIQNGKVAIIVWREAPVVFVLEDRCTYESYKEYFAMLWGKARK